MKKTLTLFLLFLLSFFSACGLEKSNAISSEKNGESIMKIKIEITSDSGNHSLTAVLSDNSSAAAFYNLLKKGPLTVSMQDYGSFEKVGSLGTSLPQNDTQITTSAGDIILYQGNQITIYYDKNSWNFTRLGKVEGVSQAELKKILGKGNVTAIFSVKN
jgi:hypothetical protein